MDFRVFRTAFRIAILAPLWIHGAEDYGTWAHQARLRLDAAAAGAAVSSTVEGFPMLVRLGGSGFPFSEARAHGEDIRFADLAGKPLGYQIERWDSAAAAAEIWVRLDSLTGASNQYLRMYWGKAGVSDNSNGASVFGADNGYVAAWHLGGSWSRPNAVAGGAAAVPNNYQGNESVTGVIGRADSLGGGKPGAYLDIGDGYGEFDQGFTYSAWIYSPVVVWFSHFFDLGNGQVKDNIVLQRLDVTQTAAFDNYQDTAKSNSIHVDNGLVQNRWQYCAITVQGKQFKYYLDGVLVASDTLSLPISNAFRSENFLGKSNWAGDEYFQGVFDEVSFAKVARSADWIKLSYASQKPGQGLAAFLPGPDCVSGFAVAKDTTLPEGSRLDLRASAPCAAGHVWTAVSGPAPRILDPEAETLLVFVPRVAQDTAIRYQFTADFGDSTRTQSVTVHIRQTIPDPVFTLPAVVTWNGRDSLAIKPVITNLAELLADAAPALHYQWTLGDTQSDDSVLDGAALADALRKSGEIAIRLCLDNGGQPSCKDMRVVANAAALSGQALRSAGPQASRKPYDSRGRRVNPGRTRAGSVVGFSPPGS